MAFISFSTRPRKTPKTYIEFVELKCLVLRYLNDFKFYTLSDLYLICRCMNRDKSEFYCNKIVAKI